MYFIALVAPAVINEEILKWKQFMQEQFECRVALRSPAHITLVPPFWMPEHNEGELKTAVSQFSQLQHSFEIVLTDFSSFKPRVIYVNILDSDQLNTLSVQCSAFFITRGLFELKQDKRPFQPHITIATRDLHKKAFGEAWELFRTKKYEANWKINAISVLRHNQKNWDVLFTSQFPK